MFKYYMMALCVWCTGIGVVSASTSRDVFKKVKDKIVIVQCDTSTGSGFVMKMEDGKSFFVTNKHVVEGQKRVAAFLLNGKEIKLGQFYVAKDKDLVRFEIPDEKQPSLIQSIDDPDVGDKVFVFGNSDGRDVATDLDGEINGVGPDKIEVTVPFVHGNSGSAVIDGDGQVLGVATYATHDVDPRDWTKRDTRFEKVRRFALRLGGVEWQLEKYESFYKRCVSELKKKAEDAGILPEAYASFATPKIYFASDGASFGSKCFRVMSDISVSLRGAPKDVKCPVIRVIVMIQGVTGKYYVRDCIMDETGTLEAVRLCPPIYGYGNKQNGWTYNIGNGMCVYYLEGLSYYQKQLPAEISRNNIKYFDKGKDAREYHQLFKVSRDICGGNKPPKIVCFRFECWQNGSLAGEYNSLRPATLNARKLPVDWFVRGKYPTKFDYGSETGSLKIGDVW